MTLELAASLILKRAASEAVGLRPRRQPDDRGREGCASGYAPPPAPEHEQSQYAEWHSKTGGREQVIASEHDARLEAGEEADDREAPRAALEAAELERVLADRRAYPHDPIYPRASRAARSRPR